MLGDLVNLFTADKAADAQVQSAQRANKLQRYMYDTSRADLAPYREAGLDALGRQRAFLSGDMSGFQASPLYRYTMDESRKALENSAAARGNLFSGDFARALQDRSANIAGNELQNYWSMLAGLTGDGGDATRQGNVLGEKYASNVGENYMGMGNARASSYIAKGNAIGNILDNLASAGMMAAGGFGR